MSTIIANEDVLEYCKNAAPGNKAVYFNMDAINELPDQFEAILTEIKFDINKDFSDVGNGNMMPNPSLMYDIARAMGISGGSNSITEPVYEEIDINPMLMKGLEAEPTFRKLIVGRKVVKYSTVIQEDGSTRRSSACSTIFNVWERCMELWSSEEEKTNGYDSAKLKKFPDGNPYYEYTWNGATKKKAILYGTTYKRKAHFNKELKFAHAKAETKSNNKTIRELAGLMTGYTKDDLAEGKFIFSRVRKSRASLKLEHMAHLKRISNTGVPSPAALELFAPNDEPEAITGTVEDIPEEHTEEDVTESVKEEKPKKKKPSQAQELLGVFQTYEHIKDLPDKAKTVIAGCIKWLDSTPDEKDPNYEKLWTAAISRLKDIEKAIDFQDMVEHKFY